MPISCAAEVAPTYGAAMRAYHAPAVRGRRAAAGRSSSRTPGSRWRARRRRCGRCSWTRRSTPAAEVEAAEGRRAEHEWERSFVAAVAETVEHGRWPAMPRWLAHHDDHPGDLMGAERSRCSCSMMGTEPDGAAEAERRVAAQPGRAWARTPMLLGYLGMAAQDRGDLDTAHRLATRSLELRPDRRSPADTRWPTCTSSPATTRTAWPGSTTGCRAPTRRRCSEATWSGTPPCTTSRSATATARSRGTRGCGGVRRRAAGSSTDRRCCGAASCSATSRPAPTRRRRRVSDAGHGA